MHCEYINPRAWKKPVGYNNGVLLKGTRTLCIAGQVARDADGNLVGENDFVEQFKQTLRNIRAVVEAAGGVVEHIGKLTIFVTDKQVYLDTRKSLGLAYQEIFGKHYPAMALIEIKGLYEPGALVEIEALAILP